MQMKKDFYQPDKKLTAVCGLFCPACGIFIAQSESMEERRKMAENLQNGNYVSSLENTAATWQVVEGYNLHGD